MYHAAIPDGVYTIEFWHGMPRYEQVPVCALLEGDTISTAGMALVVEKVPGGHRVTTLTDTYNLQCGTPVLRVALSLLEASQG